MKSSVKSISIREHVSNALFVAAAAVSIAALIYVSRMAHPPASILLASGLPLLLITAVGLVVQWPAVAPSNRRIGVGTWLVAAVSILIGWFLGG